MNINPFVLAWAPYDWPMALGIEFYALVHRRGDPRVGGTGRLRRASAQGRGDQRAQDARQTRAPSWISRARAWVRGQPPGPLARSTTRSSGASGGAGGRHGWPGSSGDSISRWPWPARHGASSSPSSLDGFDADIVGLMSGLQATFGLLLVSMTAPTALAEERARGSLDVLMTTPLSTDRIVLAKWWGAYRVVPALALLPAIGALIVGFTEPEIPAAFARSAQPHDPLGWIDRVAFVCLPTALFLAQGAVVTSFGLALATWMRRSGERSP